MCSLQYLTHPQLAGHYRQRPRLRMLALATRPLRRLTMTYLGIDRGVRAGPRPPSLHSQYDTAQLLKQLLR